MPPSDSPGDGRIDSTTDNARSSQAPMEDVDVPIEEDVLQLTAEQLRQTYPNNRYADQFHSQCTIPAREAQHVPSSDVLPPKIATKLESDLWSHQATALEALAEDENVIVTTSTSSGKTWAYALHIARLYRTTPETRALIVYPTKALSRDQEYALNELFRDQLELDITVGVYDGDTKRGEKAPIREDANVIITNFVGLNQYLEGHHRWASFYANCSLVVIDEAHMWTGLSGMHVGWILRRAQRLIEYYGGDPQYVLTSATIGNPAAHAEALTGESARVVDTDGSPAGARELVFWNPPRQTFSTSGADTSAEGAEERKRPATIEAPEVWAHLCYHGVSSLLFSPSRKQTELAVDRATEFLCDEDTPYQRDCSLASYNAGHGKQARRATENRLKMGELDGVATTSALEVGIDIGDIDGTVLMGYPGSRQSFWQQIGRSGRGTSDSLSVFVPSYATLDEYILQHPDYVLEEDHEEAVVDLSNNPVYLQHVRCAAQELPLTTADEERFGGADRLAQAVEYGQRTGNLEGLLDGGVTYAHRDRPQDEVSLYASGEHAFDVRLDGEASIDHQPIGRERAYRDYHEGATVLHQGTRYQVTKLREDIPQPYILLEPADVKYYTQSQGTVDIYDIEAEASREVGPFQLNWGYGTVSSHYASYMKRDLKSGSMIANGLPTGTPRLEMRTQLCWATVPETVESALLATHSEYRNDEVTKIPPNLQGYLGGLHAVEHAMIGVAPLELSVGPGDIGGLATNRIPETDASGWFIYDGIEGGIGFSRSIYDNFEAVGRRALAVIRDCPCGRVNGCPACLMDDRCGNDNKPLYGPAASDVLAALLGEDTKVSVMDGLQADDATSLTDPRPPASVS